jgi:hypothetical protein
MATESTSAAVEIFELPGDAVYPESVGVDPVLARLRTERAQGNGARRA